MEACFLFWGFFLVRLGGYLGLSLEPSALFSARVVSCDRRLRLRPLLVVVRLLLQYGGGAAAVSLCMCVCVCASYRAYLGALEAGGGGLVLTLCFAGGAGPNSSKRMPDNVVSLPALLVPQQQCVWG